MEFIYLYLIIITLYLYYVIHKLVSQIHHHNQIQYFTNEMNENQNQNQTHEKYTKILDDKENRINKILDCKKIN